MKLGLQGINYGPCSTPEAAGRVAQAAEAAGYESLWVADHVVLPDPQVPPSPVAPDFPMLEPTVTLGFLAGQTKTIRLGTGIIILPQRNPLVLAKELASVDVLSNGRVIFGIGIGNLKPEFDALGIAFDHKGRRAVEYLQAMQAIWSQEHPAYHGKFVSFSGVQALPRPVQKPHPPIVFGGHTPEAFGRTVQHAQGWYGFALDVEATRHCLTGLAEAQKKYERPTALGPIEISVTPAKPLTLELAKQYADVGVHRLIPILQATAEGTLQQATSTSEMFSAAPSVASLIAFVQRTAETLIGRV